MREAYIEEVDKYSHIPRKVMDMEQVMEAGFREALRALAAMEPTERMKDLALRTFPVSWREDVTRVIRCYILAAAEEGEPKP